MDREDVNVFLLPVVTCQKDWQAVIQLLERVHVKFYILFKDTKILQFFYEDTVLWILEKVISLTTVL